MKTELFKLKRGAVVTVIGGSGFLGNYVVRELAKTGATIKVVSRDPDKAAQLRVCGAVGQISFIKADVSKPSQLELAIQGSDAVINLVGILYNKGKYNFESMHVTAAGNVAKLCHNYRVKRLVHISALGVERSSHNSQYAKTKIAGEKTVLQYFSHATILRPSVIFGAEDNFTNMFNCMAKVSPVLPLIGGGNTKFQPVFVSDVAKAVVNCLKADPTLVCGKTFEIGGPHVYTIKEIIELILATGDRKRLLLPIPVFLAKIKAFFLEFMPHPLLTRDQVELLKYDSIVFGKNGLATLGISPTHMESVLKTYI
jgi:NADH dehydrogenase